MIVRVLLLLQDSVGFCCCFSFEPRDLLLFVHEMRSYFVAILPVHDDVVVVFCCYWINVCLWWYSCFFPKWMKLLLFLLFAVYCILGFNVIVCILLGWIYSAHVCLQYRANSYSKNAALRIQRWCQYSKQC